MAMDTNVVGGVSNVKAEVDTANQLKIVPQVDVTANPSKVGGVKFFSENDDGTYTGVYELSSPESDKDGRLRISQDNILDVEGFFYTAQNTGKHRYGNTTLTITWSATGLTLNGGGVTTTATGCEIRTYAFFPRITSGSLYAETTVAFTAQPTANVIFESGLGLTNNTGTAAPSDGVFFRLTSSGMAAVASFNGTETVTNVPGTFIYDNNQVLKLSISVGTTGAKFWIDGHLAASISLETGQTASMMSSYSAPWFAQQRHPGTAASVFQSKIYGYVVSLGGYSAIIPPNNLGNSIFGSYQGLSGGTMGSLANFANSANPTAAVPTNTTAALGTGLGGQFWETDTLAVTTDGVICSYQNPAGTIAIPGRRLLVTGITIDSYVQTALTGGGYNAVWSLAFGHTAVSLATTEAATAKAPRRIALGTQSVTSAAAALTQLSTITRSWNFPMIINPGEFIAVVKKKVGTAPSAGVIAHTITMDYAWI